ncbi:hypothetical protein UAY_01798 [Enterococcus moraviensis ATCC BAA-383]|uniref:DUF4145 domain-containing protein n=1 Tax=Enterococcus moraviensis ATCC BAA-383 TaxID=1158609 RepID=R2QVZ4_9ENTE|nr:DUF4145 domain-containing protein [Enterococcus moraviensis]EOI00695.1 hypothetical protein UAY_01798 [Enterococcus moraviensis ATCC BAA-383]EOT73076.1 hypothetical protein I586_00069 [Enterococcus moraviensis ATCC BAA-383]OJG68634.1 hypothetical protein RV09_GL000033 [Enterococcus moraviensis]
MSTGFTELCPFCNNYFVATNETHQTSELSFNDLKGVITTSINKKEDKIMVSFSKCPKCQEISIVVVGIGSMHGNKNFPIRPRTSAKPLPDYIPESIRKDYEEACLIVDLSPKASATLSRRCLQGMIRDFWPDLPKNTSLLNEIKAIEKEVNLETKEVLHALRQLGNIGAHPENDINLMVDIEPDEARQLIMFIEFLTEDWYIKRHDRQLMLEKIKSINSEKQAERRNQ